MPRYWVDDPDDDFDYDSLDLETQDEPVSFEEQIRWFVEKFGYEPKIKDPSAFSLSASFDFEFGLENAVEQLRQPNLIDDLFEEFEGEEFSTEELDEIAALNSKSFSDSK